MGVGGCQLTPTHTHTYKPYKYIFSIYYKNNAHYISYHTVHVHHLNFNLPLSRVCLVFLKHIDYIWTCFYLEYIHKQIIHVGYTVMNSCGRHVYLFSATTSSSTLWKKNIWGFWYINWRHMHWNLKPRWVLYAVL